MELNRADLVWNRAALDSGGPTPGEGDRALAALLLAHGLIVNGGVEHALEVLSVEEVRAAIAGFDFFGLAEVSRLLAAALDQGLGDAPEEADSRYGHLVQNDDVIVERFQTVFRSSPEKFSPL
jgi:hypothetical protein